MDVSYLQQKPCISSERLLQAGQSHPVLLKVDPCSPPLGEVIVVLWAYRVWHASWDVA